MLLHRQILTAGGGGAFHAGLLAVVDGYVVSLSADFDEVKDEYEDVYQVEVWVNARPRDIFVGAYHPRHYEQVRLGQLPVNEVTFDKTKRKSLQSARLEAMVQEYKARTQTAPVFPADPPAP